MSKIITYDDFLDKRIQTLEDKIRFYKNDNKEATIDIIMDTCECVPLCDTMEEFDELVSDLRDFISDYYKYKEELENEE